MIRLVPYWLFFLLTIVLISCYQNSVQSKDIKNSSDLAEQYCSSCHKLPMPDQLDKKSWQKYILPRMGQMLGIYNTPTERDSLLRDMAFVPKEIKATLYPVEALIDMADWYDLQNYYLTNAPDRLSDSAMVNYENLVDSFFQIKKPPLNFSPPSTCLIYSDTSNQIIITDAHTQSLLVLDNQWQILKAARIGEAATHIHETHNEYILTVMGNFTPSDAPNGYLFGLPKTKNGRSGKIVDQLVRPVHSSYEDLDNDGYEDIVIAEFGKWAGKLSIHYGSDTGTYKSKLLLNQTGAIKSAIIDWDRDGLLDVLALFGQAREGLKLFLNKGNRNFEAHPLLSFSASHGSSSFELKDMNNDGLKDVIYLAGDNADFEAIAKPYHGIYIYLRTSDGELKFDKFIQHDGVYDITIDDFDQDGRVDIAAISFFPDYSENGKQAFIFYKNSDEGYIPYTLSDSEMGRFIVMHKVDYDNDNDIDLLLGSMAFEVPGNTAITDRWQSEAVPFYILENKTK